MGISFRVGSHNANPVEVKQPIGSFADLIFDPPPPANNRRRMMQQDLPTSPPTILQSSFGGRPFQGLEHTIVKQKNGFVHTLMDAYTYHHHLVISPDDVWIAILSQFSIYVNNHAEELRSHFVDHKDKLELEVRMDGDRKTLDYAAFTRAMVGKIEHNVVDPDLRDWILPDFTTTTSNETVVCAIMMMSTLKAFFVYSLGIGCGLPSVTLEGEKLDWVKILNRIDKLSMYGPEPTQWAKMLRPILIRFIRAFDGEVDQHFWGTICKLHSYGSGGTSISGWLTAFCVWDRDGNWHGTPNARDESLEVDGVRYPEIGGRVIPTSLCEVEVQMKDEIGGTCQLVAGHVGGLILGDRRDAVRPLSAWFMTQPSSANNQEQPPPVQQMQANQMYQAPAPREQPGPPTRDYDPPPHMGAQGPTMNQYQAPAPWGQQGGPPHRGHQQPPFQQTVPANQYQGPPGWGPNVFQPGGYPGGNQQVHGGWQPNNAGGYQAAPPGAFRQGGPPMMGGYQGPPPGAYQGAPPGQYQQGYPGAYQQTGPGANLGYGGNPGAGYQAPPASYANPPESTSKEKKRFSFKKLFRS